MKKVFFSLAIVSLFFGCSQNSGGPAEGESSAHRWVQTTTLVEASDSFFSLTGTVKARHEVELAFQVGGKIDRRLVDAGQSIRKGDVLFTLDLRDLRQSVVTSRARLKAAEATLELAENEFSQDSQLIEQGYKSRREYQRTLLALKEAENQRDAAEAELSQALNALDYGVLKSDSDGFILDAFGEPGEVVSAGHPVAKFAKDAQPEVEVDFPSDRYPPESGELIVDGVAIALKRREVAGAADPLSRTWKTRYAIDQKYPGLRYGQLVKTKFRDSQPDIPLYKTKISSIDERGETPLIWTIDNGEALSTSISIHKIETEYAWVSSPELRDGLAVISLGTHLLKPGMAVRPLSEREI